MNYPIVCGPSLSWLIAWINLEKAFLIQWMKLKSI